MTIINILIGLIVGILIAMLIPSETVIGPNSKDIIKSIYIDNKKKCYKLQPEICICPINESMK